MKNNWFVCSINAEVRGEYTDNSEIDKPTLHDFQLMLSGSSVIAAKSVRTAGRFAQTYGLIGPPSLTTTLLSLATNGEGSYVHTVEGLDKTSFAFSPANRAIKKHKVAGIKGNVMHEKIESALSQMRTLLGDVDGFCVGSGLREEEVPFAKEAFKRCRPGQRVLSPRKDFCPNLWSSGLISGPERLVDCLVINSHEFAGINVSKRQLGAEGPRVIIVTDGIKGGGCLFGGGRWIEYPSVVITEQESPGTGDWFLGALVAFMDHNNLSFATIGVEEIERALLFAATVAGHKAAEQGAINGPSEHFMRQLLDRS